MISWHPEQVYLHRAFVDFRKSVNGLSAIVIETMQQSMDAPAIFVFCNRKHDKLKVLYWDQTGFALWYKRLEKNKFKWPSRSHDTVITLDAEQWQWLLRGLNYLHINPHQVMPLNTMI